MFRCSAICRVCGDRASGRHYGVQSCDGCRGFFKRSIRRRPNYECREENRCVIDMLRRNQCQACRFRKCLAVSMNPHAVQHQRRANQHSLQLEDAASSTKQKVNSSLQSCTLVSNEFEEFIGSSNGVVTDTSKHRISVPIRINTAIFLHKSGISEMERHESHLFVPYKAIGEICSEIPPAFRSLSTKRRITSILCATGNVVVQYSAERLRFISVSDVLPSAIRCVAADGRYVYAAVDTRIALLHLSRQVERWLDVDECVKFIIPFGEVIVVVGISNSLHVLYIDDGERFTTIDSPSSFTVSVAMHPAAYLNKILLAFTNGRMRLINIKSGKLLYEFQKYSKMEITVVEQSSAVDIVAVGFSTGHIRICNLKFDETLMSFKHEGRITSIVFRTDGEETMTSSTDAGSMAVWDLNTQKLVGHVPNAHSGPITKLYFFTNEPIMVSAGCDNTLKTWIYDMGDKMPRQLNLLEGHAKAVSSLKFVETDRILSASYDGSVRSFSVNRGTFHQKLGNAGIMSWAKAKKLKRNVESIQLNAIVEMDFCMSREAAWDNVLCRHKDTAVTTTWTTRKQKLGKHRFLPKRFVKRGTVFSVHATAIKLSACGNFALIGYSSGHIDCFNIQSGMHRKAFWGPNDQKVAHNSAVHGLELDALCKQMISGDETGIVRFWDFRSAKLLSEFQVPSPIYCFRLCDCNSLLAVAAGSKSVGIIDVCCRRVVRIMKEAHRQEISAIEFSYDGRWLISASNDCYLKAWDLASNALIDVMKFEKPCTGIAFSPSGEYFATCHEGERAIFLWVNKTLFDPSVGFKSLPLDYEPVPLISPQGSNRNVTDEENISESEDEMEIDVESAHDFYHNNELISLSGLPPPRWANLSNLNVIRERNKPVEPAKKPKAAPFFLPTVSTLQGFDFDIADTGNQEAHQKIIMAKRKTLEIETSFTESLLKCITDQDYSNVFHTLQLMNISSIDFQIRALPRKAFTPFLQMLVSIVKTRRDFELVQSYLAAFLSIHMELLWKSSEVEEMEDKNDIQLLDILRLLLEEQKKAGEQLNELIMENTTVIQYIKSAVLFY